ncbi:transcription factor [Apiospora sp. TS-2023a]
MAAASSATKDQPLRFACDRCHFHKLRCSRTDQRASGSPDTDEPCSRCAKAQVACVQGVRGKVGRPAKSLKRKAAQYEETYPAPRNDDSEASREYQQRREGQDHLLSSTPSAQLQSTSTNVLATANNVDLDENTRPASRPCLRSPPQYQTPDMTMFPLNPSEVGSWETLMMPHDTFEPGFVTNFDLPPFPTPTSEVCFQEDLAKTPRAGDGSDHDTLQSSAGSTPIPLPHCVDRDVIDEHDNVRTMSLASSGGQLPTPSRSITPGVYTRTNYEKLSGLNLRINAVLGCAEQVSDGSDKTLKDVSTLASELIDTARQIMPQLATETSSAETADMAPQVGQQTLASETISTCVASVHGSPQRAQRRIPDSGLVFLLLACYTGILDIFELVVHELWARRDELAGQQGGSVGSLLKTSLAVHTVNYLLRLLREALFLRDSSSYSEIDPILDESADWRGDCSAGKARAATPAFGLLSATCTEMRDREQRLLRRTQHLQQLLIR